MIRKAISTFLLLLLAGGTCTYALPRSQSAPPAPPKTTLKVGQPAPDFTLIDTERRPVKLSDFKGKKTVVLAFYVLAFTGG